ncbi:MAG: ExbD/TolR family protein [Pirellulaceae bacterium]
MSSVLAEPSQDFENEFEDEEGANEPFLTARPAGTDDEMDITPMIDITFLLLIFFLVSSKMDAEPAVDLPKARHGGVVAAKDAVVLMVNRGSGDEAEVQKADGSPFSRNLEQQNAEIAEYVQQGLDSGKKRVIIRGALDVRQGELNRVSEAISESLEEGDMINIAVMEQG